MPSMLPRAVLLGGLLLASASKLSAAPILIDFEGIADFTDVGSLIPGLTFSNAIALQAGISLNELDFPPVSGSTVVFDNGGPMHIDFAAPIDLFSGYFTYTTQLLIQAFNSRGELFGTVSSASGSNIRPSSPNELISLSLAGIASVTITGDPFGGSFTLDDLSYQPASSVPEPGTGMLVGAGLALLARKRHSARKSRAAQHPV